MGAFEPQPRATKGTCLACVVMVSVRERCWSLWAGARLTMKGAWAAAGPAMDDALGRRLEELTREVASLRKDNQRLGTRVQTLEG